MRRLCRGHKSIALSDPFDQRASLKTGLAYVKRFHISQAFRVLFGDWRSALRTVVFIVLVGINIYLFMIAGDNGYFQDRHYTDWFSQWLRERN